MTLRQTIQAAPAKTNELIAKLANTSNQAVKTREGLFGALTDELSLYVDVEEQHLLPLLRKHAETKALAAEAAQGNKELRAQLAALSAMPKDNDEFLAKVVELKKNFQQHVRDERNELLPAVLKALSDEEAAQAAEKIEAVVAEADGAKRAAKHAEAGKAKRKATEAQQAEEDERAAVRAERAAQGAARDAAEQTADNIQQAATEVRDGTRKATQRLVENTTKAVSSAREAIEIYRGSSENLRKDLQAISASSTVTSKVAAEFASAMGQWARRTAALNADAPMKMMRCRSFAEFAQAQREYAEASVRTWMEGSSTVLEITQRASTEALNPLQARMEKAA